MCSRPWLGSFAQLLPVVASFLGLDCSAWVCSSGYTVVVYAICTDGLITGACVGILGRNRQFCRFFETASKSKNVNPSFMYLVFTLADLVLELPLVLRIVVIVFVRFRQNVRMCGHAHEVRCNVHPAVPKWLLTVQKSDAAIFVVHLYVCVHCKEKRSHTSTDAALFLLAAFHNFSRPVESAKLHARALVTAGPWTPVPLRLQKGGLGRVRFNSGRDLWRTVPGPERCRPEHRVYAE